MNQVEEIKEKLDIAEIIANYIPLNQAGTNLKARCPFHNEKTASFMVSREKQIYHCFGCDQGGDVISFVQEYEGISFAEALRILAEKAGVQITSYSSMPKEDYSKLYKINEKVVEFYEKKLFNNSDISKKVLEYLDNRKISKESIKKWRLGLSGESWDEVYNYLKSQGFNDNDIFKAGITLKKKSQDGYIDRFRKRLMFPISDVQGRVVAFTSRTLSNIAYDEEEMGGKYINSPQSAIYDKSKILYGWHLAKTDTRRKKYLIIVEGNMDAIASQQSGTENTVAVSGTAMTVDHIKIIKRYTDNIILAFDGDAAGSRASLRSISLGWKEDMNIKILVLDKGKDPADMVKEDSKNWKKEITKSLPVMEYYFKRVIGGIDISRGDHKKIAVRKLLPMIKVLQSKVEQSHYLQLLSEKLNIPLNILEQGLLSSSPFVEKEERKVKYINVDKKKKDLVLILSENLLAIVLYKTEYLDNLIEEIETEAMSGDLQSLYKKSIIYYTKHHDLDEFAKEDNLSEEEKSIWIKLSLLGEKNYGNFSSQELDNEFKDFAKRLKQVYLKKERQILIEKLRQAELVQDSKQQDNITHKINLINKELNI